VQQLLVVVVVMVGIGVAALTKTLAVIVWNGYSLQLPRKKSSPGPSSTDSPPAKHNQHG
jgi:hypothetical protein